MTKGKLLLIVLIAALIAVFIAFELGQYFSLSYLKSQQTVIEELYRANPFQTVTAFFLIYVAATGLSLPGAKSRIQRGRKLLMEKLLDCCHIDLDRRGNVLDWTKRKDCRSC